MPVSFGRWRSGGDSNSRYLPEISRLRIVGLDYGCCLFALHFHFRYSSLSLINQSRKLLPRHTCCPQRNDTKILGHHPDAGEQSDEVISCFLIHARGGATGLCTSPAAAFCCCMHIPLDFSYGWSEWSAVSFRRRR